MKKPYFTIITTCYNAEDTIKDTLNSVLRQTNRDYEYIIFDANSTDTTVKILEEFQPVFEGRMIYVSENDKGIYDGMNKGILAAQGKYVSILNSDDYYGKDTLEMVYKLSQNKQKLPIVFGDICRVTKKKKPIYRYHFDENRVVQKISFGHPSMFLPKIIYDMEGLYDQEHYPLAADLEFQQKLYLHYDEYDWIVCDKVFTYMREGGSTDNPRYIKEWINQKSEIDARYRNIHPSVAKLLAAIGVYGRIVKNHLPYQIQRMMYNAYRKKD